MNKVAIIGGGISGLCTAFLLKRKGIDATVYEASSVLGGNLQTVDLAGYTVELGPNSLLRSPRMVELIRMLDMERDVIGAHDSAKKRFVLLNGKLRAFGPWSLVNGYFSFKSILTILREPLVRSKAAANESVADFVSRRLGSEVLNKAVDPFVSGIHAGDPANLSIRTSFPRLYELERDFGSVIVGAFRSRGQDTDRAFPRTFSFRGGIKRLVDRLAESLGDSAIKVGTTVKGIEASSSKRFKICDTDFDAVVISTPAKSAADLIQMRDPELAEDLTSVFYAPVTVAIAGYRSDQIEHPLDGFGFLIPSGEGRPILGTVFVSAIFPERAPKGRHLLTTFLGGVRNGHLVDSMTDEQVKEVVTEQLAEILKADGEPEIFHIKRWPRAIPQYRVGYEKVEAACETFEQRNPGIYFCSNFYRGISVGDCVKNAFLTAERVAESLK